MNGMKLIGTMTLVFSFLMAANVEASKAKAKAAPQKAEPMMTFAECCDLHDDTSTCQSLKNVKDKAGKTCPKMEEEESVEMDDSDEATDSVDE